MARARNIKPGFFKNELLVELPVFTRLLFIGLWTLADREGRIEDRPKRIKLELFPCDNDDVDAALNELAKSGFIERYEAKDRHVIQIINFLKHQTPHGTEKDSELPDKDGSMTVNDRLPNGYITGRKRQNNVKSPQDNSHPPLESVSPPFVNALNPDLLNPDSLIPESKNNPHEAGASVAGKAGNGEDGVSESNRNGVVCPSQAIVDLYHELMPLNPRVKVLNDARRSAIRARWREAAFLECAPFGYSNREDGLAAWRKFFEVCAESEFLTGRSQPRAGHPVFVADIDFLMSPSGFAKCLENKYHRDVA